MKAVTRTSNLLWVSALFAALMVTGCPDDIGAPTARITFFPETPSVGVIVQLDGSLSSNPEGGTLGYAWRFAQIPSQSQAQLNDPSLSNPSFTPDVPGQYTLQLTVSNSTQASDPASVVITVGQCGANVPMIAAFSTDPSVPIVGGLVRIIAEITDEDLSPTCGRAESFAYEWVLTDLPTGSIASLSDPNLASPWILPNVPGNYTVSLQVTDSAGLMSEEATYTFTVSECGDNAPLVESITNQPLQPSVERPISLAAVVSDLDNGAECGLEQDFSYRWTLETVPVASVTQIQRATQDDAWFEPDIAGEYVVGLVVRDDTGRDSERFEHTITVGECGARAPIIASITPSNTAPSVGEQVTLSAEVTDADTELGCGEPAIYAWFWEVVSIPAGSQADVSRSDLAGPAITPDLPGAYVIRAEVTDPTGLTSAPVDVTLTAGICGSQAPTLSLAFSPAAPVIGQPVGLEANASDADTEDPCNGQESFTYHWSMFDSPLGSTAVIANAGEHNAFFVPDVEGTFVLEAVVTDTAGNRNEELATIAVTVVTDAAPTPELTASTTSGLVPLRVDLTCDTATGEAPFTYAWQFGNGTSSSEQNPSITYSVPGQYVAACTIKDSNGDRNTGVVVIDALVDSVPEIVGVTAGPIAGVAPLAVDLSAVVEGGTGVLSYSWNFGDGSPVETDAAVSHTFTDSGLYTVTLEVTDENGDVDTRVLEIAVGTDETPVASIVATPDEGISPVAVRFSANVAGGNGGVQTYEWDFDDGDGVGVDSNLPTPQTTYSNAGPGDATFTATLTVYDEDGTASVPTTRVITVEEDTVPGVTAAADFSTGLAPFQVAFTCAIAGGNAPVAVTWSFGNGVTTSDPNPTYTYNVPGAYAARCTAVDRNGDVGQDTVDITVEVDSVPEIVGVTADPSAGVAPLGVDFSAVVEGGTGVIGYAWDFGDGATDATAAPTHSFAAAGTFRVSLVVTDGNGDQDTAVLDVVVGTDDTPSAGIVADPQNGISPLTVRFSAVTAGGNGDIVAYWWDFDGDGSPDSDLASPTWIFTNAGPADALMTVVLRVTDEDGSVSPDATTVIAVAADSQPVVTVSALSPVTGTAPLQVALDCAVVGGNDPIELLWELGDGTTSAQQSPVHTYVEPGQYDAACDVMDANGDVAGDSITITVEVDSVPVIVGLSADPPGGLAPVAVQFTSVVEGGTGVNTYAWDFDDMSAADTRPNPDHTFAAPGIYAVTLQVIDGNGDSDSALFEVVVGTDETPVAAIVAAPTEGVSPVTVSFSANAAGGNGDYTYEWDWDASDGLGVDSTLATPSHTFVAPIASGTVVYTVTLTVIDADGDRSPAAMTAITVYEDTAPAASAAITGPTSGVAPFVTTVTCSTSDGNPPFSYLWDFGDGSVAFQQNLTHTYATPGSYPVTCTVTDGNGDTDTASAGTVTVTADSLPTVSIDQVAPTVLLGAAVNLTATATGDDGPLLFTWVWGDGNVSVGVGLDAVAHTYASPGTYRVTLTVEDTDGDTAVDEITVGVATDDQPSVSAAASPDAGFDPLFVQFTANPLGGNGELTVDWDFDDTNTSTLQNPTHTYAAPGTYTATVTVTDDDGDTASSQVTVVVAADTTPVASIVQPLMSLSGVTPYLVSYRCDVADGNGEIQFQWDFGDGGTSNLQNPTHIFEVAGLYNPTCTVTDEQGQSNTDTAPDVLVEADLEPTVDQIVARVLRGMTLESVTTVVQGEVVELDVVGGAGNGLVSWEWDYGDGVTQTFPASPPHDHVYGAAGVVRVWLTVEDTDGDRATGFIDLTVQPAVPASATVVASTLSGPPPLTVDFSADVQGNLPVEYVWDIATEGFSTTAASFQYTFESEGSFDVDLVVIDLDGDVAGDFVTIDVSFCGYNDPILTVDGPADLVPPGSPVTLTASATDADEDVGCGIAQTFTFTSHFVSVPPFSTASLQPSVGISPSFTGDQEGDYVIETEVRDQDGNTDTVRTTVGVGFPLPLAEIFFNGADDDFNGATPDIPGQPRNQDGLFVAPFGTSGATGTMGDPFDTIDEAVQNLESTSPQIFVMAGTYAEGVDIPTMTEARIIGGFGPMWDFQPGVRSAIDAPGGRNTATLVVEQDASAFLYQIDLTEGSNTDEPLRVGVNSVVEAYFSDFIGRTTLEADTVLVAGHSRFDGSGVSREGIFSSTTILSLTLVNSSSRGTDGIDLRGGTIEIINSVIDSTNQASIRARAGSWTFVNSVIYGDDPDYGIRLEGGADLTLENTDFFFVTPGTAVRDLSGDDYLANELEAGCGVSINGCDSATAILEDDPLFLDAQYHVDPTSPLLDQGRDASSFYTYPMSMLDIDGELRPLDGNGDFVPEWDIGVDEVQFMFGDAEIYFDGMDNDMDGATPDDVLTPRDQDGLFVSSTGRPGAFGTSFDPYDTISEALLNLDPARPQIFVEAQGFTDTLVLDADVRIYGGFDGSWNYDPAGVTDFQTPAGVMQATVTVSPTVTAFLYNLDVNLGPNNFNALRVDLDGVVDLYHSRVTAETYLESGVTLTAGHTRFEAPGGVAIQSNLVMGMLDLRLVNSIVVGDIGLSARVTTAEIVSTVIGSNADGVEVVFAADGDWAFRNSVIFSFAPTPAAGLQLGSLSGATFSMFNSNIFLNDPSVAVVDRVGISHLAPLADCGTIDGCSFAVDNLAVDPMWIDGDYHLDPMSPLVEQGMDVSASYTFPIPQVDFDGEPRPLDGDNAFLDEWDIGVDEVQYVAPPAEIYFNGIEDDMDAGSSDVMLAPRDWDGLFVSPTGAPGARGTQAEPLDTIEEAIALLDPNRPQIFLEAGIYTETPLFLDQDVRIFGDFDMGWVHDPGLITVIQPVSGPITPTVTVGSNAFLMDLEIGVVDGDDALGIEPLANTEGYYLSLTGTAWLIDNGSLTLGHSRIQAPRAGISTSGFGNDVALINSSVNGTTGIDILDGTLLAVSSVIEGRTNQAILFGDGTLELRNSVVLNTNTGNPLGVDFADGGVSDYIIRNSVFWVPDGDDIDDDGGSLLQVPINPAACAAASNCTDADFNRSINPRLDASYHQIDPSPLAEAGEEVSVYYSFPMMLVDIDGEDRPQDSDFSGTAQWDIGIDEVMPGVPPPTCAKVVFDGAQEAIIPNSAALQGLTSWTAEAWVYLDSVGDPVANQVILSKRAPACGAPHILLGAFWDVGPMEYRVWGVAQTDDVIEAIGTAPIPMDTWVHVAAGYDEVSGNVELWFNGVPDGLANRPPIFPVASDAEPLFVGNHSAPLCGDGGVPFVGQMAGVRVGLFAPPTVEYPFTPVGMPTGLWGMAAGAGTTIFDSTPEANHGTLAVDAWVTDAMCPAP